MNWLELLVYGGAVPFSITAAFAIVAHFRRGLPGAPLEVSESESGSLPERKESQDGRAGRARFGGVGVAAAFAAGYTLFPWAPWRPESEWQWIPWLVMLAAVTGTVAAHLAPRQPGGSQGTETLWRWQVILALSIVLATTWLIVPDWSDVQPVRHGHRAGLFAALLLLTLASADAAKRMEPSIYLGGWWLSSVAAAVLLGHSGNLKFAQLEGLLAAASGALLCVSLVARQRVAGLEASHPLATAHLGLLYLGWMHSFSEIPWASYTLIALAPALLDIGRLRIFGRQAQPPPPTRRTWLILAPLTIALAIGMLLAL